MLHLASHHDVIGLPLVNLTQAAMAGEAWRLIPQFFDKELIMSLSDVLK